MAREKRSFPFTELDIPDTNSNQNKWKKQCISSEFLQKNSQQLLSVKSLPEDIDMEYENCTNIHHKNDHIAFEDFQNGYDSHMDVRFKNGYGLQTTCSTETGQCQNSLTSIQNGHNGSVTYNNNNGFVQSSCCLRCQAGEPGHIGHIGR